MSVKIGACYVRVSTSDQLEYSPEGQVKLIQEHAKRDGYIIPPEFIFQDDGISGKSADKRPSFRLMIATAKESEPPFDTIFVWKYSRFARNQEEAIMYKNLLKKRGIDVRSVSEPSSDSPFSSLIERIIEWMDEYYLINLAEEVRRGMAVKAKRGEAMGKPPLGYRVENKILVPDENAPVVRHVFERYAAGASFREIAVELRESGGFDKLPDVGSIRYILKNPTYIGKTRWSADEHTQYQNNDYHPDVDSMVDGLHEAIIPRELWDSTQARLSQYQTEVKYTRENHPVQMLKGIVRCSNCGATLTTLRRKPKPGASGLQCNAYNRGACNVSHYIREDKLNQIVIDSLEDALASNHFNFSPPDPGRKQRLTRDWDKLIAAEEGRLKRAKEAYLNGVFSVEEYGEAKAEADANIERLKAQREKEDGGDVPDLAVVREKVSGVLIALKSPDMDGKTKNEILRSIVDKIIFKKPENTVEIFLVR